MQALVHEPNACMAEGLVEPFWQCDSPNEPDHQNRTTAMQEPSASESAKVLVKETLHTLLSRSDCSLRCQKRSQKGCQIDDVMMLQMRMLYGLLYAPYLLNQSSTFELQSAVLTRKAMICIGKYHTIPQTMVRRSRAMCCQTFLPYAQPQAYSIALSCLNSILIQHCCMHGTSS